MKRTRITRLLERVLGLTPRAVTLFLQLVGTNRKHVIVALVASLVSAVMEGGTLAFLALALDSLSDSTPSWVSTTAGSIGDSIGLGSEGAFVVLVGAAVVTQVLHSLLHFASDVAAASLQANVEREARTRIFDQFMDISYAEARKRTVGELSSHLDHVNFLGFVINRMHEVASQLLLLAVYLVLLFWISWQATLISMAAMLVLSVLMRALIKRVRNSAQTYKKTLVTVTERSLELLNGLRVLHSFGREQYARERVGGAIVECARERRRGLVWQSSIAPAIQAISVFVLGGILIGGFIVYGSTDRGKLIELASFLLVVFRLAPKLSILNKSRGLLAHYLPFFERISDILARDDKQYPAMGSRPFTGLRDRIEFRNVTLVYPGTEEPAISNVQLELSRGRMVALVGESGAGKTTISDLLLGLYPVTTGEILVDGVPLRELDWDDWRAKIGVVSQDTFLMSGTIRDNIRFGKLDATDAEIERAARGAHAHEFITQLEHGYATSLGEQGFRLSGGQKQRLAIARAILRDPEILILDEATSDLDSESEALIHESMMQLRANRTMLVIAHRLSTVAAADEIIVLRRGQVVERGRHAELVSLRGTYARFVDLQTGHVAGPPS